MIILGTNVISEGMKRPDQRSPAVFGWMRAQKCETLYTTTLTVAEIWASVEVRSEGARKEAIRGVAERIFNVLFLGRILPFDEAAARAYGRVVARRRREGVGIGAMDAQIIGIALTHGFAIATRDRDFGDCGATVIDPWTAP